MSARRSRTSAMSSCCNVTETNDWPSRVLITDLLPAGFEIDNPSLVNSAKLSNFDWIGEVAAGPYRIPQRPFRRRLRPVSRRQRPTITLRLCRARGDARHLRSSGRQRRGHVPAAVLRPHGDGPHGGLAAQQSEQHVDSGGKLLIGVAAAPLSVAALAVRPRRRRPRLSAAAGQGRYRLGRSARCRWPAAARLRHAGGPLAAEDRRRRMSIRNSCAC